MTKKEKKSKSKLAVPKKLKKLMGGTVGAVVSSIAGIATFNIVGNSMKMLIGKAPGKFGEMLSSNAGSAAVKFITAMFIVPKLPIISDDNKKFVSKIGYAMGALDVIKPFAAQASPQASAFIFGSAGVPLADWDSFSNVPVANPQPWTKAVGGYNQEVISDYPIGQAYNPNALDDYYDDDDAMDDDEY